MWSRLLGQNRPGVSPKLDSCDVTIGKFGKKAGSSALYAVSHLK